MKNDVVVVIAVSCYGIQSQTSIFWTMAGGMADVFAM